jgi:hypothetical protein
VEKKLYEFTLKVLRGQGCDLPDDMQGAYVPCYAGAPDYQSALRKGVTALNGMRYVFDDVFGEVREIPLHSWADYVAKVWPEFTDRLPSQEELPGLVEKGEIFFGPFAGFRN